MECISNGFIKNHVIVFPTLALSRSGISIPHEQRDRCRVYSQIRLWRNTPNDFHFKEQVLLLIYIAVQEKSNADVVLI